jgi:hypothetical protein
LNVIDEKDLLKIEEEIKEIDEILLRFGIIVKDLDAKKGIYVLCYIPITNIRRIMVLIIGFTNLLKHHLHPVF